MEHGGHDGGMRNFPASRANVVLLGFLAIVNSLVFSLIWAFAHSVPGIPIAAGVLLPPFGILPSPMIAVLAMVLGSHSVIGNALRLRTIPV